MTASFLVRHTSPPLRDTQGLFFAPSPPGDTQHVRRHLPALYHLRVLWVHPSSDSFAMASTSIQLGDMLFYHVVFARVF